MVAGLVTGTTPAAPLAAAVAREELGGEAGGADLLGAGGLEVAPWAGWVAVLVWTGGEFCGGLAAGELWWICSCCEVGWHCVWEGNPLTYPPPWEKLQWGEVVAAAAA